MKSPTSCASLNEVRTEIDQIDQEIIALIGQRAQYVQAAAQFKTSATSVRAPDRYAAMLEQRRLWAGAAQLDPDVIEQIYHTLVDYFIEREMREWQTKLDDR